MKLKDALNRGISEEHGELCTPTFKLLAPKTLASAIQQLRLNNGELILLNDDQLRSDFEM